MAYLGRISAVLTANVADFTRGIGDARREIQSFAQSARNIEVRLNTRALDESLTRLQRFTRTLDEIRDLQARGVDAGLPDPNRLRDQFRAYEDLGRGITRVKDSIEGLSTAAQAGLLPALEVLQSNFQNVYNSIRNGTTTYDEQRDRVEALRESLARLTRQQSAVAAIGSAARRLDVDSTGASFVQPQAIEALQRTLALRNQAEQVPARLRGSVFNELSIDAQRNADLIERQAARVSRALLDLGNGTGSRQAVQSSQSLLDSLVQRQRSIIARFETELRSVRITGIVDPEVGNEAENLTSRLESLSEKLRGISTTKFDPLIAAVGRIVEQFNRAATSADKAKAAVNSLAAVEVSENLFTSSADSIKNRLTTETERNREAINRAASQAIASIEAARNIPPPNAVLPSLANMQTTRDIALVNSRRDAGLAQEDFRSDVVPRVERLARDSIPLGDEFTNKAASIRREALALSQDLQAAFEAGGQDPVVAAGALDKYKSGLERLGASLDEFESKVRRASAAQKQFDLFLRASGGSAEKLDPALARAATDIVTARQFTGQFSEDNIQGRVEVAQAVAQAERDILKLTQRKSEIDDDINLTTKARSALLAENTQQVKAITKELLTLVAASSGGIFDEKQVQAAADRLAKSTGSFGAAGFNNFNLAIQQSLFAVDDLISSTGPLEYKLRAVGNNISQLGLTLGQSGVIPWLTATKGLAIGVGAVLAGQVAVGLYRYATSGVEAADKAKALNEALQRQRSLVDQLAKSFDALSQSLSLNAFQGSAKDAEEFRRQVQALREEQRKALREQVSALDPSVIRERELQAARSRELERATDVGRTVILQRELEQSRARERAASDLAISAAPVDLEELRRRIAEGVGEQARTQLLDFTAAEPDPAAAAAAGRAAQGRFLDQQSQFPSAAEAESALRRRLDEVAFRSRRAGPQERLSLDAEARGLAADLALVQRSRVADEEKARVEVIVGIRRFGLAIEQSQESVSAAISQGIPGAAQFSAELERAAESVSNAEREFRDASDQLRSARELPNASDADREARDAAVRSATQRSGAAQRQIDAAQQQAERIVQRSLDFRLRSAGRSDRASAALQALQSSETFANDYSGVTSQLQSAIEREKFAREQLNASNSAATQGQLAAARAASDLAASAAEAALAIDADFARLRQAIDSTLQVSQQAADEAQRRVSEAGGFGGRPVAELERERDRAQADLRADRSRLGQLSGQLQVDRALALQSPQVQAINQQIEAIRRQREVAGETARLTGRPGDVRESVRLSAEQARLENERSQAVERLTAATRKAIEAENQAIAQRTRQQDFLRAIQEQLAPAGDPLAGLDAIRTPAERVGISFQKQFADIDAALRGLAGAVDPAELARRGVAARRRAIEDAAEIGLTDEQRLRRSIGDQFGALEESARRLAQAGDVAGAKQFVAQGQRNLSRQNAPLFAQFSDEVASAVLQGPSRAALQVSDASTTEGQRELNRLLRGDDSARDVNLVELQKQSTFLQSIDSGISTLKERLGIAQ